MTYNGDMLTALTLFAVVASAPVQITSHFGLNWEVRHGPGFGLGGDRDKAGVSFVPGFPFEPGEGTDEGSIVLDFDKTGKSTGITCRTLLNGTGFGQAFVYFKGDPSTWGPGFGFGAWFYRDTVDNPAGPLDPITGKPLKSELDAEWYLNDWNDPAILKPGIIHYSGNDINRQIQKPVPGRSFDKWKVRLSRYPTWSAVTVWGYRYSDKKWLDVAYQKFDQPSEPGATLRIEIFNFKPEQQRPLDGGLRARAMITITGVTFLP